MRTSAKAQQSAKKKPIQARSLATVECILAATAHILATVGYDGLTTNRVALRAGVSIGSLYQYFPSKEALVGELMDRHCERMNALFGTVFLAAQSLEPKGVVREVIGAIYRAKRENPELSRVLREQLPRLGRLKRLEEDLQRIADAVAAYLAHHRSILRVKNPARAAFYAVELGESLTMASVVKDRETDSEVAIDEISDIVNRYLFD